MDNIRSLAFAASATFALAVAGSAAHGDVLTPGGSGTPDLLPRMLTGNPPGGEVALASGTFTSDLGADDFTGSYVEYVYRGNSYGANDLTWYIEVTNNTNTAAANIEKVSVSSFKGFATDVGYCQTSGVLGAYNGMCYDEGTVLPTSVSRTSNGTAVNFDLDIPPNGSTTDWLMVVTNAQEVRSGNLSFIDEGTATVSGYAPNVPEPSTWAMLCLGFAGIGVLGFAKRRRDSRFAL
jgi:hypothetical protein